MTSEAETMVERIARIIESQTWHDRDQYVTLMTQSGGCHPEVIARLADERVAESVRKARAVLTALLDPTEEMVEAGGQARDVRATIGENTNLTWRAMIQAALQPGSEDQ